MLTTLFAGCADGGATPEPTNDAVFEDLGGEATSTTGLIRGVVFDATITPIEGVTVRIKSIERETTTNADGAFVLDKLEPGIYFLDVRKIGFGSVQQSAEVKAGVDKPAIVKVQLIPNPSELPQVIPYVFDGFIQCSVVAFVVAYAACSQPETAGVDLGDEFITFIDTGGYPTFVQDEIAWSSSQALGSALSFSVYDGSLTAPREQIGESPLVITGDRAFWENGTGSAKSGSPMVDEGETLSWRVFAGGSDETRGTLIWGLGVTVEQSFNIFTHLFWNMVPEESWQFSVHGPPVVPT